MLNFLVDENFLASAEAQGLRELARCGECLARCALESERQRLSDEEAAATQWARCAQCRCGVISPRGRK